MNADRLLELYDKVAEAPDAIDRLRSFLLDLAVRGKLVEQDPAEEPASELLERIEQEKVRLVKAGKVRNKPDLPPVEPEVQPHPIPNTWRWVRFANIVDFSAGRTPSRNDNSFWNTGDYPWVSIADIENGKTVENTKETVSEKARKVAFKSEPEQAGTMIMSFKLTIGKIARLGVPAFHNEAIISIRPHLAKIDPYLFKVLPDLARDGKTKGAIKGATLNRESLSNILIPLAPLAEQRRIVAKVEEMMALLDRLEAARTARETTRDRLTTASLARLTAPDTDPEAFPDHARFALDALPKLTARSDQVKSLRQTILNLAVRGKLVEQDMSDEPASDLLKRIAEEKRRLIREGKFKTFEGNLDRNPNSFTFSIPSNWSWCYLDDVAAVARGGSPRPIKSFITDDPDGIPWIKIGDSNRGSIYIDETRERIKPEGLKKSRLVIPGDLLLSNSMSFGFPYITNVEGCIHDGWLVIRTPDGLIDKLYLHKVFLSDYATAAFSKAASGAVVQNLNADKARQLAFPLPPIAEQRRIVAKVEELMALLNRLDDALAKAATTRGDLLEALLYESLGKSSTEREAA